MFFKTFTGPFLVAVPFTKQRNITGLNKAIYHYYKWNTVFDKGATSELTPKHFILESMLKRLVQNSAFKTHIFNSYMR